MTHACSVFGLSPDQAIWEEPLARMLAMCACHGYSQGLEPTGETYLDQQINLELARIKGRLVL